MKKKYRFGHGVCRFHCHDVAEFAVKDASEMGDAACIPPVSAFFYINVRYVKPYLGIRRHARGRARSGRGLLRAGGCRGSPRALPWAANLPDGRREAASHTRRNSKRKINSLIYFALRTK